MPFTPRRRHISRSNVDLPRPAHNLSVAATLFWLQHTYQQACLTGVAIPGAMTGVEAAQGQQATWYQLPSMLSPHSQRKQHANFTGNTVEVVVSNLTETMHTLPNPPSSLVCRAHKHTPDHSNRQRVGRFKTACTMSTVYTAEVWQSCEAGTGGRTHHGHL